MIEVGTKVKIVDNIHEHINYIPGTVGTIIDSEDDYYFLDIGYCVSEAEIELV